MNGHKVECEWDFLWNDREKKGQNLWSKQDLSYNNRIFQAGDQPKKKLS